MVGHGKCSCTFGSLIEISYVEIDCAYTRDISCNSGEQTTSRHELQAASSDQIEYKSNLSVQRYKKLATENTDARLANPNTGTI